jgi:hypothetical protein
MITQTILTTIINFFKSIFDLLPNIPPLPSVVTDGAILMMSMVDSAMQLVVYLVGMPLFYFIVATVIFFTLYDFLVHLIYRIIIQGLILKAIGR